MQRTGDQDVAAPEDARRLIDALAMREKSQPKM
jgi:hypothetical protein